MSFSLPAVGSRPHLIISETTPPSPAAIVVELLSSEDSPELPASPLLTEDTARQVYEAAVALGAKGKAGEITRLLIGARPVITLGLGSVEDLDSETARRAAGSLARALANGTFSQVALSPAVSDLAAVVEGLLLGGYSYRGQRRSAEDSSVVEYVIVDKQSRAEEIEHAQVVAEAVLTARDLTNTSANVLYPEVYAEWLREQGEAAGLEVEVLDEKALAEGGYGGILAVGAGSVRPPRLVRLSYCVEDAPLVALVGKGITFDTGGISLKPASRMENMISDMGGSAAMASAVMAAAKLRLPVSVTTTVALAENMPSGSATRPGDVVAHYGGVTTEIINTDAEGRLVLADAIARASEDKPAYLVEASTLTGAQLVALGARTTAVMGSEAFRDRVAALGREVGENAWPLPMLEEHDEEIKSIVADIRNTHNSRNGGTVFAARYLEEFVGEGIEWAHLDVAGPAWNDGGAHGYTPKRATGQPVRTVLAVLEDIAK